MASASTAASRHQVLLVGQTVPYWLHRVQRKSIGFVVAADTGLTVRAPRGVALATIEQALHTKADWIVRKLAEQQQRQQQQAAAQIDWREGGELPWLGAPLRLRLGAARRGAQLVMNPSPPPGEPAAWLHLGLPLDAGAEPIRHLTVAWLREQARPWFEQRCAHFAPQLAVQPRAIQLSSASTRWGSASVQGVIRLNWRLIHLEPGLIDYVVVHELAHLRQMNHSPAFWALVEQLIPDCAQRRQRLRAVVLPP